MSIIDKNYTHTFFIIAYLYVFLHQPFYINLYINLFCVSTVEIAYERAVSGVLHGYIYYFTNLNLFTD